MWLSDLTKGRYEVREKKSVKKVMIFNLPLITILFQVMLLNYRIELGWFSFINDIYMWKTSPSAQAAYMRPANHCAYKGHLRPYGKL